MELVKWNIEKIKDFVESFGYTLISATLIENGYKIDLKDKEDYYYESRFYDFLKGKRPRKFDARHKYSIYNIKHYLELNLPHLILISDKYVDSHTPLIFKDIEGFYYTFSVNVLQKDTSSYRFHHSNLYTINNIKYWLILNKISLELLSQNYNNAREKLEWKCNICNEKFTMEWQHIHENIGCPYCAGQKVGLSNCLATKNPELAKEWHPTRNGDLTPYDVTSGSGKKVWWQCKNCRHEWNISIDQRSGENGTNCPKCNFSKGESITESWLADNNIKYIPQKTFDNCRYKYVLRFDFYLPEYNLLIEYQGRQHYESVEVFGGD